ncbi:MAG: hypothetical protein NZ809_04680, partial [Thermodesulfovibrio sp.]|nr:hypothetical protein [Thermodesulfovibrio sp.]
MSFQLKIFIMFAISMVFIFSAINFVTIYFFKEEQQRYENEILNIYREILRQNRNYPLPPYINRYGDEIIIDKRKEERFFQYSKTVLIWESLFILVLSYLFLKILNLISKKEKEYEEFLKFLFFVLSHKIGNFLSVMKTNIEILKLKPETRVIERIEHSCNLIDDELKKSMETIKKLPRISRSKQTINLNELINRLLLKYETDKRLIITSRNIFLDTNVEALETIIFLLLDNAFRYAHSKIHIKIC